MINSKRGPKKLLSGPYEIANAEELFIASVENGDPDFRYIALAIGENPFEPPRWAILECMSEKERTSSRAASRTDEVSIILDEVVRYFVADQFRREDDANYRSEPFPELRTAIRNSCAKIGKRTKYLEGSLADANWCRDIERAWKTEQDEVALESYPRLLNWKGTKRIADIISRSVADELGFPVDIQKALWVDKQIKLLTRNDK